MQDELTPIDVLVTQPADTLAGADTTRASFFKLDSLDTIHKISRSLEESAQAIREGRIEDFFGWILNAFGAFIFQGLIPSILLGLFFYGVYRLLVIALRKSRPDDGVRQLSIRGLRLAIAITAGIMILDQLGVNVTTLIAGFGIAGIALGFAARDTLENMISGITILVDSPFRVGDMVTVSEVYGTIKEITLRSTRVLTPQNHIVVFPNTTMVKDKLVNHTVLGIVRVDVPFTIGYTESPKKARDIIFGLIETDRRLHPDYPPTIVVLELDDKTITMSLRIFLKDARSEYPVQFEYMEMIRDTLRENGILAAFPHVHVLTAGESPAAKPPPTKKDQP